MRVLQIEDDAETARTVTMILESEGHDCDTADCGEQALDLAHNAEYDIILLDIGLPDIDGYQVLNQLRESGIMTPVVIQSGLVLRKNKMKGLGVEDCLAKPFGRRELRESLQTVIPGHAGHR
jgi:DNA-binding response OmpR family regulator